MKLDEWEEDPQKEVCMLMPDLIDEFKYTIDEMSKQGTLASKIFGKNRKIHPTKITFSSESGQHVFYPEKDLPVVERLAHLVHRLKSQNRGERTKTDTHTHKTRKLVPQDTDMNDVYKKLLVGAGFTYYKIKDDLLDITGKGSQPITGCSIEWKKSDFYDQTNL